MPLLVLIEAAKAGNEQQVEEFSQLFHDHANKLIEVLLTYQFICTLFAARTHTHIRLTALCPGLPG